MSQIVTRINYHLFITKYVLLKINYFIILFLISFFHQFETLLQINTFPFNYINISITLILRDMKEIKKIVKIQRPNINIITFNRTKINISNYTAYF